MQNLKFTNRLNRTIRLSIIASLTYVLINVFEFSQFSSIWFNYEWDFDRKLTTKKVNILTLGGSVTCGAGLNRVNRYRAYPFRLNDDYRHKVTNAAIRGTGSGYPAQCIKTMLESSVKTTETDLSHYDQDVPFDVIILEFSINGIYAFELLIQRLRERFPDAFFIYLEMFSLKNGAFDASEARDLVKKYGGEVYYFGNTGNATMLYDYSEEINNPGFTVRKLFANDQHHPNANGHDLITAKLNEIINDHEFPPDPKLGGWFGGDDCVSWYMTGDLQDSDLRTMHGGKMNQWDVGKHKFAIEVDQEDGAILKYTHKNNDDAAVSIQYMTKSIKPRDPYSSMYPPVVVTIKQELSAIVKAKTKAMSRTLNLNIQNVTEIHEVEDGWRYLIGWHRKEGMRKNHVTEISNVGISKPGENYIYIYPMENRSYPFRLTSLIVCDACAHFGWNEDIGSVGRRNLFNTL